MKLTIFYREGAVTGASFKTFFNVEVNNVQKFFKALEDRSFARLVLPDEGEFVVMADTIASVASVVSEPEATVEEEDTHE